MKKMLLVLMILAFAATTAMAQGSYIGMYADEQASACDIAVPAFVLTSVFFFAQLDPSELSEISAVQFKVDNLPNSAVAIITPAWDTGLVIGDLGTDIALAFSPPVDGPLAFLGSVTFFALSDFGLDYLMTLLPADSQSDVLVVTGPGVELPAGGSQFTFNCSDVCACGTATDATTWSSIKSLF